MTIVRKESENNNFKNQEKVNNIINTFSGLEDLIISENTDLYKEEILSIIDNINSIGESISDDGLRHDLNRFFVFLGYINLKFGLGLHGDHNVKDDIIEAKKSIEKILKTNFSIIEIMNLTLDLAIINDLSIDFKIDDDLDENTSINFEIDRLLRNLISNSKEAFAKNIFIKINNTQDSIIFSYLDDGEGMSEDIILNTLFKKGESTKLNSGRNYGEGMYGLSKLFHKRRVLLDIFSNNGDKNIGKGFNEETFSLIVDQEEVFETELNNLGGKEELLNKKGTNFIFKFNK